MRKVKISVAVIVFFLIFIVQPFALERITVAIMNFNVTNLQKAEVDLLIDFFNNALFETGMFDVVQRDKRDKLLQEIEFSFSDLADSKKTRELGKLLSVKLVLFGSVGKLGSNILFNITMVDVDTGRTVSTFSQTYKNLEEIVSDLPKISISAADAATQSMFMKKTNVIYYDDFEHQNWTVSDKLFYSKGTYNIYSTDEEYFVWETLVVDDFVIEAEANFVKGSNNIGFGVVYRLQDENNFYGFWITNTGYYKVSKRVKGEYTDIVTWTKHTAININAPNVLKVVAIGTLCSFYVNNLKVKELFDNTYREGKFGLFAFQDVQAAFNSIIVYQGNLIFYDYFSKPSENWSEGEGAYTKDGVYMVNGLTMKDDFYTWSGELYKNISLKTEAIWMAGGTDTGYGLVFRLADIDNHYSFYITRSGYYRFGYYLKGTWTTIVDWKKSRIINTAGKNILRVECVGESFALYVNDNLVETVSDATFAEGYIGFVAYKGVNAAFDNVELFLLN